MVLEASEMLLFSNGNAMISAEPAGLSVPDGPAGRLCRMLPTLEKVVKC